MKFKYRFLKFSELANFISKIIFLQEVHFKIKSSWNFFFLVSKIANSFKWLQRMKKADNYFC